MRVKPVVKNLFIFILLFVYCICYFNNIVPAFEYNSYYELNDYSFNANAPKTDISRPNVSELYARYVAVLDGDNNRLLYSKAGDTKAPMASTTKIMTCVIALEYCDSDFICTTSSYAASMPDVQLNATRGELFYINDILYSLMLKSHNDSAVIIAENTAYNHICKVLSQNKNDDYNIVADNISQLDFLNGHLDNDSSFLSSLDTSQSKVLVHIFTSLMNKKAEELGCVNTHFVTPNGLDGEDEGGIHSTTATELATIMAYCIKNSEFLKITQTKEYTFSSIVKNEKDLSNSDNSSDNSNKTNSSKNFSKGITYSVGNANAFLNMYENIISGKTGFTGDAGYCYICAYQCDGRTFIVALLACGWPNNKTYKWHDAKLLLNWARQNYFYKELINSDTPIKDISLESGMENSFSANIKDNVGLLLGIDDVINITYDVPTVYKAPVYKDDVIGSANIYVNDCLYKSVPIYATDTVMAKTFLYYVRVVAEKMFFKS